MIGEQSRDPSIERNAPHGAGQHPDVKALFRSAYAGRPFVRLLDQPPELTHAVGTNYALLHVAQSADGREAQVMVAIDNLVKGASGQAVQNMNLMLGYPEATGLEQVALFP